MYLVTFQRCQNSWPETDPPSPEVLCPQRWVSWTNPEAKQTAGSRRSSSRRALRTQTDFILISFTLFFCFVELKTDSYVTGRAKRHGTGETHRSARPAAVCPRRKCWAEGLNFSLKYKVYKFVLETCSSCRRRRAQLAEELTLNINSRWSVSAL